MSGDDILNEINQLNFHDQLSLKNFLITNQTLISKDEFNNRIKESPEKHTKCLKKRNHDLLKHEHEQYQKRLTAKNTKFLRG